ncbi:hypothetical protein [Parachryseolinea silvisoli]|uniref:hypothetical protein n=1 Tax=Parachryseolinea silvisoli TaxID=2873601 RepID=UPI00226581A8|nr:hypothetical protein [Parachryseolinea silvisoli]MCD9016719.1 hypothetical protein [Parachryseolinea silvisoli]
MIPSEIIDFIETVEIQGDIGLYINSLRREGEELIFEVCVDTGSPSIANRSWTITTKNLRKSEINMDWGGSITLEESHCLLSEFNQLQSSLYFEGDAANPEVIFHKLYRIHGKKYGDWIRFGCYFNGGLDLVKLLSSRNGLLAQGPKDILEAYARVLTTPGIITNFVLDRAPTKMEWSKL